MEKNSEHDDLHFYPADLIEPTKRSVYSETEHQIEVNTYLRSQEELEIEIQRIWLPLLFCLIPLTLAWILVYLCTSFHMGDPVSYKLIATSLCVATMFNQWIILTWWGHTLNKILAVWWSLLGIGILTETLPPGMVWNFLRLLFA